MTSPDPAAILAQINSARDQTYQNIALAQGILDQANAAASAAAQDRAAIQAIAQQTVRVDTSVGTRVFAGDTMIFGDTGWRAVPADESIVSGSVHLRRVGHVVTLKLLQLRLPEGSGYATILSGQTFPSPFRPEWGERMMQFVGSSNNAVTPQRIAVWDANVTWHGTAVNQGGTRPTADLTGSLVWTTSMPWPTSLPGTAA